MQKDKLYSDNAAPQGDFRFDDSVAAVFPDMLQRSIPGYHASLDALRYLARTVVTPGSSCYDLGCSLGAATLAMRQNITHDNCKIVAIDNSAAMIEHCQQHIDADQSLIPVSIRQADIRDVNISNASLVTLNYTLQFLQPDERAELLQKIYEGLLPGGALLLSEKFRAQDAAVDQQLIDMHHDFKRRNGYSELEISRKRNALEKVLIPDTLETHFDRLKTCGFSNAYLWFQQFNFCSIVAWR